MRNFEFENPDQITKPGDYRVRITDVTSDKIKARVLDGPLSPSDLSGNRPTGTSGKDDLNKR